MYEWEFNELTGGIWTMRYDKNFRKIYEGDKVKTLIGIGIVRYNPKYWRFEVAYEGEPLENERIPAGVPEECWEIIDD